MSDKDDLDNLFRNLNKTEEPVEAAPMDQHVTEEVTQETDPVDHNSEIEATTDPDLIDDRDEDEKLPAMVPLATMLNVKTKYRGRATDAEKKFEDAQRENAELRQRLEERNRATETPPYQPDPFNDPRGYFDERIREVEQRHLNEKMAASFENAKEKFGDEAVMAAVQWGEARANSDADFDAQMSRHPKPIEWAVQQHQAVQKQQAAASKLTEVDYDLEALVHKMAIERGWISADTTPAATSVATQAPAQTQVVKARPTSLRNIQASNSKATPQAAVESLDNLFRKKR